MFAEWIRLILAYSTNIQHMLPILTQYCLRFPAALAEYFLPMLGQYLAPKWAILAKYWRCLVHIANLQSTFASILCQWSVKISRQIDNIGWMLSIFSQCFCQFSVNSSLAYITILYLAISFTTLKILSAIISKFLMEVIISKTILILKFPYYV